MAVVLIRRVIESAVQQPQSLPIAQNEAEISSFENTLPALQSAAPAQVLTKREIQIIQHYARGLSYQDIATTLFISPQTVRTHLKNIYQKLDLHGKAEAVQWAVNNGLL